MMAKEWKNFTTKDGYGKLFRTGQAMEWLTSIPGIGETTAVTILSILPYPRGKSFPNPCNGMIPVGL
jgi:hypothetical protein